MTRGNLGVTCTHVEVYLSEVLGSSLCLATMVMPWLHVEKRLNECQCHVILTQPTNGCENHCGLPHNYATYLASAHEYEM